MLYSLRCKIILRHLGLKLKLFDVLVLSIRAKYVELEVRARGDGVARVRDHIGVVLLQQLSVLAQCGGNVDLVSTTNEWPG